VVRDGGEEGPARLGHGHAWLMAQPTISRGLLATHVRNEEASRDGGTLAPVSSAARVLCARARQGEDAMGLLAVVVGLEARQERNSRAEFRAAMVALRQAA